MRISRISQPTYAPDYKPLSRCIIPLQNRGVKYGYARVSTDGQSVDAQVRQLRAEGCQKVFREVASRAKTDALHTSSPPGAIDAGSPKHPCCSHRP